MSLPRVLLCAVAAAAANLACAASTDGDPAAQASQDVQVVRNITIDGAGGNKNAEGPEKLIARLASSSAQQRVVSTSGLTEFVLTGDAVTMQMTDLALKRVEEPRRQPDNNESLLAGVLKNVALSAVRHMFDHGIAMPLRETRSAVVRDGQIVVTACNGKEVFGQVKINDSVQTYPQQGADAFVKNLMQARSRLPACGVNKQAAASANKLAAK